MAYDIQFVDSIAAAPTVRLNLKAAPWTVLASTEFGMPELRRSVVSTLLTDGVQYPAAAYGGRMLTLVLRVDAATDDAAASALQLLYRELDRPTNILLYRPGTSAPVFFRTFRAGPDSVTWDPIDKVVTAQIPAEPFAYGLKESLSQVTVSNNPASGCFFDVTGVKGDVETPLYLRFALGTLTATQRQSVIAVRRRGTPSAAPFVLQAETSAGGTDTTLGAANDPAFSGPGQNYVRTTFATDASMRLRFSISTWPSSPSVDVRGTYRAFARVRKSVAGDTIALRLAYGNNSGVTFFGDTVTLRAASTDVHYADLGLLQFPIGADPVTEGMSGVEIPVKGLFLAVYAQRVAGTGNLDSDLALLLVPADDRLLLLTWQPDTTATAHVLDSARDMVYAVGSSGEVQTVKAPELAGSPPMVSPGVTNRVTFMQDTGSKSFGGDVLANTTAITPYYWPRYLYVRPVAS